MLESASKQVSFLLEKQDFNKPMRFAAVEENDKTVDFLLEPVTSGGFFRKEKVSLNPVAIPR